MTELLFTVAFTALNISMYFLLGVPHILKINKTSVAIVFFVALVVMIVFLYLDYQRYMIGFQTSAMLFLFIAMRSILYKAFLQSEHQPKKGARNFIDFVLIPIFVIFFTVTVSHAILFSSAEH